MKKLLLITTTALLCLSILSGCSEYPDKGGNTDKSPDVFDCYYNLDTFKGLELYVWKTGDETYRCGLMSGTNRSKTADEIAVLPPATSDKIKSILDSYNIPNDNITVIPILNPTCSYKWTLDDTEIQKIQEMFGNDRIIDTISVYKTENKSYYDMRSADIDGDGTVEDCILGYGFTSGVFTFTFTANVDGRIKYGNSYRSMFYYLSFTERNDKVFVQGITQGESPETHLIEISVENGDIMLADTNSMIPEAAAFVPLKLWDYLKNITLDNYTLEFLKHNAYVVMEDGDVTAGQDDWDRFIIKVGAGETASIRYVNYYTRDDKLRYDSEHYAEAKNSYPCMFVHELSFDGKLFIDFYYDGETNCNTTYKYMLKYEGMPSSVTATFSAYTYYVLVDDNSITWADCEKAMFSSQSTDWVKFNIVYSDLVYKEN